MVPVCQSPCCVAAQICRRPATRRCWVCTADICELCTRALHWKVRLSESPKLRWVLVKHFIPRLVAYTVQGAIGPHWPLINRPGSMAARLGRQEFERKRLEDAAECVPAGRVLSGRAGCRATNLLLSQLILRALAIVLTDLSNGSQGTCQCSNGQQ